MTTNYKYKLTTADGTEWWYTEKQLEDAKCDQYIFGGKIEEVDEDEAMA